LSRSRWIDDAEINSKARYTNLRVNMVTGFSNDARYSLFEWTVEITAREASCSKLAGFSEMK